LVYFGYTSCPDVCPTTLLDMAQALDALGPRAGAVQPLFITVDPKRDTPAVLTEYVKSFHPRLIALTGTPAQLAATARSFHVFHERHDNDDGGYSIDTAPSSISSIPTAGWQRRSPAKVGANRLPPCWRR
jgi:protein SCO1/2